MFQSVRASEILEKLTALSPTTGFWAKQERCVDTVDIWTIATPGEWTARFDFDGCVDDVTGQNDPLASKTRPFLLDLWSEDAGIKVLSLRWSPLTQSGNIVSMKPGPWEVKFGLPARDWSASDARKLAQRKMTLSA